MIGPFPEPVGDGRYESTMRLCDLMVNEPDPQRRDWYMTQLNILCAEALMEIGAGAPRKDD